MYDLRIEQVPAMSIIGLSREMNLIADQTVDLFKTFLPQRAGIPTTDNSHVYLLKLYSADYFKSFSPANTFVKFAGLKVDEAISMDGFEKYHVAEGLYAIFRNRSNPTDSKIFEYIFREWLPQSDYLLDDRPHIDVLPNAYWTSINKEEDICIPIKVKG